MTKQSLASFLILIPALALARPMGNERGGGVPQKMPLMPEDARYTCHLKLTQLNFTLHRPLISRTTVDFAWKKGDDARLRTVNLDEITDWKHYQSKIVGPFAPVEEEVPELLPGATFNGHISLGAPMAGPGKWAESAELGEGFRIDLVVAAVAKNAEKKLSMQSEANALQTLESRKSLKAKARLSVNTDQGNFLEQQILEVVCDRTE